MRFPEPGDQVVHQTEGRLVISHWRDVKGRRQYFSGSICLGFLEDVLPIVIDLVLVPKAIQPSHRVTLDMSQDLFDSIEAACKKVRMTKSQYMRCAIEVLNLLANETDTKFLLRKNDCSRELFIPGISRKKG